MDEAACGNPIKVEIIINIIITFVIIMKFYDREKEMELMEHLNSKKPGFLVVTGRRRVGKTELIKEFIRHRKALYYFVDSNKSIEVLMREFGQYTSETLALPSYVRIDTPESLIDFLFSHDSDIVAVFDEFQRFQKLYPAFITQLQKYWDMRSSESKLFLITSGSSVGMIKKIFIEGGAPLFRRADNIVTLQPFKVQQIFQVLDDLGIKDLNEKLNLYFLFGGTIYYYRLLEKYECKNLKDAFANLIFNDLAPLRREMGDVLIEEFGKEHATYYEIISAIAEGKGTQKEITDYTHISPSSLPPYIDELINLLGIVEHRVPVTDDRRSKKGRYFLKDNFFRFYARFIYRNMSLYQGGRHDILTEKTLSEWNAFTGWGFEEMVREILREKLSGEYDRIGSWWNRRGDEIDLLALGKKNGLAVEIKNSELSMDEAMNLIEKMKEKLDLVKGLPGKMILGIAAMKVYDKEIIRSKGFYAWDLDSFFEE